MSNITRTILLLVGALAVLCLWRETAHLSAQDKAAPPKTVWEYKVSAETDEATLNKLGAEGWELCGTTQKIATKPVFDGGSTTWSNVNSTQELIFKRGKR